MARIVHEIMLKKKDHLGGNKMNFSWNNIKLQCSNSQKTIKILIITLSISIFFFSICHAGVYLDNTAQCPTCINGNTKYDPITRSCGQGSDTVYTSLASFNSNIVSGESNYIRSGSYWRTGADWSEGALKISQSGTSSQRTVVRAYPGEERKAIIFTQAGKDQYNPNPADKSSGGQGLYYYPCPAISLGSDYTDVIGLKTYGQVLVGANNSMIQDCDIGGGGPYYNWGHVLYIRDSRNVTIRNNWIHNSPASGEANTHKAMVQSYRSRDIVYEYNTFSNAYEYGLACGDARGVAGGAITVRYNFIDSPQIGWMGIAQYGEVNYFYIHNNIFYNCSLGISTKQAPANTQYFYNNTLVNCQYDFSDGDANFAFYSKNNLFYHSSGSGLRYYNSGFTSTGNTNADYNVYYSNGSSPTFKIVGISTTSFSTWQSSSGEDGNSLSHDPSFVNASGTNPEDFKRLSYIENFTNSPYGVHAGAYESGNEIIGASIQSPTPPPGIPPNMRIIP